MSRIVILIPKDNVAYNFRAELFLKLHELGHEVFIVCPYGKKLEYFRERMRKFIPYMDECMPEAKIVSKEVPSAPSFFI